MKMRTVWPWAVLVLVVAGCRAPAEPATPRATLSSTPDPQAAVCREGLLRALEREMARYETWLDQAGEDDAAQYQAAYAYLRDLYDRVQATPPTAFQDDMAYRPIPGMEVGSYGRDALPDERTVVLEDAWITEPLPAMVSFSGQTRSGPFYIAVASVPSLEPGRHYRLTLRLLMPGTYPFPEFYVCVLEAEPR